MTGTGLPERPPAYDLAFSLFGIPVRVSIWFWVVGAVLGYSAFQAGVQFLLAWLVVLFVSIMIHELGHAVIARAFGYAPSILLHQFGGLVTYGADRSQGPWRSVSIAFAGPVAGFLFLGALLLGRELLVPATLEAGPADASPYRALAGFVTTSLIWVNLWWGLLNLLPVLPLDGGQVCRELCAMGRNSGRRWCAYRIGVAAGGAAALLLFTRGYVYAASLLALLALNNASTLRYGGDI